MKAVVVEKRKEMDQFYTNDEIALKCVEDLKNRIDIRDFDRILEPAAGTGSFFKLIPEHQREGIDIDPKHPDVVKQDFLHYKPVSDRSYCVIGNPPFGKGSSLAIRFFNHAASFADVIAFIIPRTFKRVSVQNRLNLNFHLVDTIDLPLKPCCFDPVMSAKCCFQVWTKKIERRKKVVLPNTHPDFDFMHMGPIDENGQPTPPDGADFAVKAYGSNCGKIKDDDLHILRPKSWHWIKSHIDIDVLKSRIRELDFGMSKDTVRQDSIGRSELIYLYRTSMI